MHLVHLHLWHIRWLLGHHHDHLGHDFLLKDLTAQGKHGLLQFVVRDGQLGENALGTSGQDDLRIRKGVEGGADGLGRQRRKKLVSKFFIWNYLFIKFTIGRSNHVLAATCLEVGFDVLNLSLQSVRWLHCCHGITLHDLRLIGLLLHNDLDWAGVGVVAFLVAWKTSDVEVLVQSSGVLVQDALQISLRDLFLLAIARLVSFYTTTMADDFVFYPVPYHEGVIC